METSTAKFILNTVICIVIVAGLLKVANWVWVRPKKLERQLRQQGLLGTSYKLFYGDLKEISLMRKQALKTPMSSFSNNYIPRILPFPHRLVQEFGMISPQFIFY